MKRSNFGIAIANLIMETISDLQKCRQKAALKDIKEHINGKFGNKTEKFMRLVPQYIKKGLGLGLIAKYGDNFRTKMYVARRRKGGRHGSRKGRKGGRRRRRRRR